MDVFIRRLSAADVATYGQIRLESLQRHPDVFGTSYEEEAALPDEVFVQQLTTNLILGGGADEQHITGIVGFIVGGALKVRHKGILWGLYVQPEARGSGLAKALVNTLIDAVKDEVEQIQLSVGAHNVPAARLYQGFGFEPYGLENSALKVGEQYLDEVLMALDLRKLKQS